MEIEYRSKDSPYVTNLLIRQVYDNINHCMITYRQAIDKGYLDTELFLYSCLNINLSIHEAFYRGLILGELCTNIREDKLSKKLINIKETNDYEYEIIFSTLTNIVNSLSEFTNTIHINNQCQLTSDGYIQHKITGKSYLLTQAIELDLVSFKDNSQIIQSNNSTLINDTNPTDMDISYHEEDLILKENISVNQILEIYFVFF